jgi:sulfur carrier protein ThiS
MRIIVDDRSRQETLELPVDSKARDIFSKLGCSAQGCLVVRNGSVISHWEILHENDRLELIRAISGG